MSEKKLHLTKSRSSSIHLPRFSPDGEELDEHGSQRRKIMMELFQSEVSFIQTLDVIILKFLKPMRKKNLNVNLDVVFLNIEDICELHKENNGHVHDVLHLDDMVDQIASIYQGFAEKLKVYEDYVIGYEEAAEEVQKWLSVEDSPVFEFLDSCGGMPLQALLIQPIQRLCRYPLLFGEVLKFCDPHDVHHANVKKTLDELERVTSWINKTKRKHFNEMTMRKLDDSVHGYGGEIGIPGRVVMFEGSFAVTEANVTSDFLFSVFMFNDMIMWCRSTKKDAKGSRMGSKKDTFVFEDKIEYDAMTKVERVGNNLVRIENSRKHAVVIAKDSMTADHFMFILNDAVNARKTLLDQLNNIRIVRLQREKESVLQRLSDAEEALKQANIKISKQEKQIEALQEVLTKVCQQVGVTCKNLVEIGQEGTEKDGIGGLDGKKGEDKGGGEQVIDSKGEDEGEVSKPFNAFIAMATTDYISEDPAELSFAFGELILITRDLGTHFLGRMKDSDILTEQKVDPNRVCKVVRRGMNYVRDDVESSRKSSSRILQTVDKKESLLVAAKNALKTRALSGMEGSPIASPSFRKKKTIDLSPSPRHIQPVDFSQEVILRQGWMMKKGNNRRNWKRRFFILTENVFHYYENMEKIGARKPLGMIALEPGFTVKEGVGENLFFVPTAERTWEFKCESGEDMVGWLKELRELSVRKETVTKKNPLFMKASTPRGSERTSNSGSRRSSAEIRSQSRQGQEESSTTTSLNESEEYDL